MCVIGDVVEFEASATTWCPIREAWRWSGRFTVSSDELHERYGTRPVRTPHDRPTAVRTTAGRCEAAR